MGYIVVIGLLIAFMAVVVTSYGAYTEGRISDGANFAFIVAAMIPVGVAAQYYFGVFG